MTRNKMLSKLFSEEPGKWKSHHFYSSSKHAIEADTHTHSFLHTAQRHNVDIFSAETVEMCVVNGKVHGTTRTNVISYDLRMSAHK